jgi:acetolactate synthase-1/2/3 large subunit
MLSHTGRRPTEGIEDKPVYLPDFVKIAEAHGAAACRVTTLPEVDAALRAAFARKDGPTVIECIISPTANVYPMIPPGAHVSAMTGHVRK